MMIMFRVKSLSIASVICGVLLASSAHAVAPTNVDGLVGVWKNVNADTRGIVKVVVWKSNGVLKFKSYGSCSPTPCVHTTVVARPHSAGVSSNTAVGLTAFRNSGFKYAKFSARRLGPFLRMDQFSTFAGGDSRKNYTTTEIFYK
jgi:hypothetical protein